MIEQDVPLGPLTTYRVGGAARWFATAESVDDLREVAELVRTEGARVGR
jgi:UDP-N-acetylenolpyruvoylglucosamine reductase